MSYVPIKVGQSPDDTKNYEVEDTEISDLNFEETPNEEEPSDSLTEEDDSEPKEPKQEPHEKNEEEEKVSPKTKKKKQSDDKGVSRSEKRIKQLLDLNKRKDAELEEKETAIRDLNKRLEELETSLSEGSKKSTTTMKSTLEGNLKVLTENLRKAMENGDADEAVRLQDEMMTTKMQLAGLDAELNRMDEQEKQKVKQQKEQPKQQKTNEQPDIPELALEWVKEHPQFTTDPMFYQFAMYTNNQLLQEGYDENSEDFYEELNERLAPRFPEIFGTKENNEVNYNNNNSSSNEEQEDENDVKQNKPQQTVSSGSSRSPLTNKQSSRSKDTVKLSPEDIRQAERWGLSLDKIARRVAHAEKNKRNDGYVPIIVGK